MESAIGIYQANMRHIFPVTILIVVTAFMFPSNILAKVVIGNVGMSIWLGYSLGVNAFRSRHLERSKRILVTIGLLLPMVIFNGAYVLRYSDSVVAYLGMVK